MTTQTPTSNRWSSKRLTEKLRFYCDDPYRHGRYFDEQYENLRNAIATGSPQLTFELGRLSNWYANDGVRKLIAGDNQGLTSLNQSVYFAGADVETDAVRHRCLAGSHGMISATDCAGDLSRAIVLSSFDVARQIATTIFESPLGVLGGLDFTLLPSFVFRLYSEWANLPLPPPIESLPLRTPYTELLAVWKSQDAAAVAEVLYAACDFHMARSRYHNNKEYFEFNAENLALQPVEILAVLRMRESLGLVNPELDHPILNTPAGRLYPPIHVDPDPIIAPALEVARAQWEAKARENSR